MSPLRSGSGAPARVVAVIPARGGSKGVPGKNLRRVAGRPLIERAVDACRRARQIEAVFVSTDDPQIAATSQDAGAEVLIRPPALTGDAASSESALLDALGQLVERGAAPDVLVFVQCTSPFVDPADLDRAVVAVTSHEADAVFAAVATHAFVWRDSEPGGVVGLNHDPARRARRQDKAPDYRETGAFYVLDVAAFLATGRRFCGRVAPLLVSGLGAVDVDTEDDLALAQALAPLIEAGARSDVDVDVVITDFDGVHTDDTATLDATGLESVRVSRADGLGVERLQAAGVPLVIVSKEVNPVVRARATKLGVEVLTGISDKGPVVREWLVAHQIAPARAAYLGNDVNDLGPMRVVGWPVAVADAREPVRAAARLVLRRPGGQGAVRELCELVLAARPADADAPADSADAATTEPGPTAGSAGGPVRQVAPGEQDARPARPVPAGRAGPR